jgi:polysaccharide biosynthesis/export protein
MALRVPNAVALTASVLLLSACAGGRLPDPGVNPPILQARGADPTIESHQLKAARAARSLVVGDLLDVMVFAAPELSRIVRVGDDGMISLPLLGPIRAGGRTPHELEVALQDTLRRSYMRDPKVVVEVKEAAVQPIYVVGEVIQPGAFVPSGQDRLTVLRAVAVAKGLKPTAAQGRVVIIRPQTNGEPLQIRVNVHDVVKGKVADLGLIPNDVVYVPKNSERAIALGLVDAALRVVTLRAVF